MRTTSSLTVCHACPPATAPPLPHTHPPCHTCPPPTMQAPCHAYPPAMHTPPAMHAPCHACPPPRTPLPCHACPCPGQNSWHTLLKISPCPNFFAGGKNLLNALPCRKRAICCVLENVLVKNHVFKAHLQHNINASVTRNGCSKLEIKPGWNTCELNPHPTNHQFPCEDSVFYTLLRMCAW